jgi:hypothetical protein
MQTDASSHGVEMVIALIHAYQKHS